MSLTQGQLHRELPEGITHAAVLVLEVFVGMRLTYGLSCEDICGVRGCLSLVSSLKCASFCCCTRPQLSSTKAGEGHCSEPCVASRRCRELPLALPFAAESCYGSGCSLVPAVALLPSEKLPPGSGLPFLFSTLLARWKPVQVPRAVVVLAAPVASLALWL